MKIVIKEDFEMQLNLKKYSFKKKDLVEANEQLIEVLDGNSGSYDIVEVENVLDGIIEQAERINEQALIESRNELLRVVATVLVVVLVEVFLWRGFPRLYWSQWLKRRGDWTVK